MYKYYQNISQKSKDEITKALCQALKCHEKRFVVTANPEIMIKAQEDSEISNLLLDKETLIVPDGISIVKRSRHFKHPLQERITGIDLTLELLEYANSIQAKVYFLGANQETLTELLKVIKEKWSQINIVGSCHGYIKNKDEIFLKIQNLQPDLVLVALGVPTQEKLIYRHYKNFKKGIFMGVGGSFDVLSGTKKRAPQFLINHNLEWMYRIFKEPKRLSRFFKYNLKFILMYR